MSKVDAARTGSKEAGGCEHWRLWPRAVRFHCLFLSAQQGLLQRVAEPPMASRGSTGFEGSDEAPQTRSFLLDVPRPSVGLAGLHAAAWGTLLDWEKPPSSAGIAAHLHHPCTHAHPHAEHRAPLLLSRRGVCFPSSLALDGRTGTQAQSTSIQAFYGLATVTSSSSWSLKEAVEDSHLTHGECYTNLAISPNEPLINTTEPFSGDKA